MDRFVDLTGDITHILVGRVCGQQRHYQAFAGAFKRLGIFGRVNLDAFPLIFDLQRAFVRRVDRGGVFFADLQFSVLRETELLQGFGQRGQYR